MSDLTDSETWQAWSSALAGATTPPKEVFVAWDVSRQCFACDWTCYAGNNSAAEGNDMFPKIRGCRRGSTVARILRNATTLGWRAVWGGEI